MRSRPPRGEVSTKNKPTTDNSIGSGKIRGAMVGEYPDTPPEKGIHNTLHLGVLITFS